MASNYIVLDTCIISEAQKTRPRPEVSAWLRRLAPSKVAIPFQVIFEVSHGIKLVEKANPRKAQQLAEWFEELLGHNFLMPQLTPHVASIMAEMATTGSLKNYWLGAPEHEKSRKLKFGSDPIIAATAIAHGMPIATVDARDYMLIHHYFPLPGLYDPIADEWVVDPPVGWSFETESDPTSEATDHDMNRMTGGVIRLRA
jgi:predicted nucleic acid-binding protein